MPPPARREGAAPPTVEPSPSPSPSTAPGPSPSPSTAPGPSPSPSGAPGPSPSPSGATAPGPSPGPGGPAPAPLIDARGLVKRFGGFTAVDGIDFTVAPGEAFGFLGPNGAGKSSTMRMIGAVSPVTEGRLRIFGLDPATHGPAIRARLGVVPQDDNLDLELSVFENMVIYGRYFGLARPAIRARAEELLEFVHLTDRRDDRVDPLSGGLKRRLTIARALINEPDLLLLDEPTTGLDPQARHVLWDRLYRLKQQGVTLVLTTHYMDEAEQLCDRLVVMDKARIVAEGSPRELISRYSTRDVVELRFPVGAPEPPPGALDGLADRTEVLPDRVLLYTADGDATLAGVEAAGLHPESVVVRRASLEDVFLRLTGRTLVE
ncbi:MAG: ABC transporter ATP-binding protein [Acidimicrobiia bacterium]|nr:ABC transporter ATP-binding protein [Acidimicrobiia bacterium]